MVIGATDGSAVKEYTYDPFGKMFNGEYIETKNDDDFIVAENPFKFIGHWYDEEIGQYYARARMYDPAMRRFTGRDLISGNEEEPLALHKYLYCLNNPINLVDLNGKSPLLIVLIAVGGMAGLNILEEVTSQFESGDWDAGKIVAKGLIGTLYGAYVGVGAILYGPVGAATMALGWGWLNNRGCDLTDESMSQQVDLNGSVHAMGLSTIGLTVGLFGDGLNLSTSTQNAVAEASGRAWVDYWADPYA